MKLGVGPPVSYHANKKKKRFVMLAGLKATLFMYLHLISLVFTLFQAQDIDGYFFPSLSSCAVLFQLRLEMHVVLRNHPAWVFFLFCFVNLMCLWGSLRWLGLGLGKGL